MSATEAARSFSDLLGQIRYRGQSFVIERGGEAVCRMTPVAPPGRCTVARLVELLRDPPRPDAGSGGDLKTILKKQPRLPRSSWER